MRNNEIIHNISNETFHKTLFENNQSILLLINADTFKIEDCNISACSFYGYSYEEMLKLKITDFNTNRTEQVENSIKLSIANLKNNFYFKHSLSNGQIRHVEFYATPIVLEGKKLLFSIIWDITNSEITRNKLKIENALLEETIAERTYQLQKTNFLLEKEIADCKNKEDALNKLNSLLENKVLERTRQLEEANSQLKEKNEMKDEFLSLISHEFKTPLTVINSAVQAMEVICRNELSDKAKGFLNKIRQNSNRQFKLINNLLDVTRANSGHLKIHMKNMDIVLLTKLITESITIFAEQKGIKLSFSSTLGKKVIGIDEEKYERVVLNLLSNAVKFTPFGKSIAVKVSQKIVTKKSRVCIQIIDKGFGIPQDKKELIFERFGQVDSSFTRQAEGTGIGLYLVKMLVELMGGEITLESQIGAGSTFSILLPIIKAKDTPIEQMIKEITDNRLIQATVIEFSDV